MPLGLQRWDEGRVFKAARNLAIVAVCLVVLGLLPISIPRRPVGNGLFFTTGGGEIRFGRALPPVSPSWWTYPHHDPFFDLFYADWVFRGPAWFVAFPLIGPSLAMLALAGAACGILLAREFRRRLKRRPVPGRCVGCGYDLAGLPAGAVCPECGAGDAAAGRSRAPADQ